MDTNKIRQLLDKRDDLDRQIAEAVNATPQKKAIRCSSCGEDGHTARTCPQKSNGQTTTDPFSGQ